MPTAPYWRSNGSGVLWHFRENTVWSNTRWRSIPKIEFGIEFKVGIKFGTGRVVIYIGMSTARIKGSRQFERVNKPRDK